MSDCTGCGQKAATCPCGRSRSFNRARDLLASAAHAYSNATHYVNMLLDLLRQTRDEGPPERRDAIDKLCREIQDAPVHVTLSAPGRESLRDALAVALSDLSRPP